MAQVTFAMQREEISLHRPVWLARMGVARDTYLMGALAGIAEVCPQLEQREGKRGHRRQTLKSLIVVCGWGGRIPAAHPTVAPDVGSR